MRPKIAIKQNIKLFTLLFIVFLSLSLFFSYYFQNNFNHENILKNVEYKISLKDKNTREELYFLKDCYQQNPDSLFSIVDRYKNVYEEEGSVYLIFKTDSLIFWSDNKSSISYEALQSKDEIINSGNGWFRKFLLEENNITYAGLYQIKSNYPYQNEYLENTFHKSFEIDSDVGFSRDRREKYLISDTNNNFLFALLFDTNTKLNNNEATILFILFAFSLIFLIAILFCLHLLVYKKTKKRLLFIFGFIADLVLIRFALFYFKIPGILFTTDLFSPHYYAYSDYIPSLGDLFLNAITLLIISFFFFYQVKFSENNLNKNRFHKYFIVFSLFLHIFIFYKGISFVFKSLILDSSISLDLNNIFSLSTMSLFSMLIVSAFILSYILVSSKLAYFAYKYCGSFSKYIVFALIAFSVFLMFCQLSGTCDYWQLIFVLIYILSFGFFYSHREYRFSVGNIVFFIFLFSIISTYLLHKYNTEKETEYRKLLAVYLASEQRDPLAEYMFQQESDKIYGDENIISYLNDYGLDAFDYDEFYDYFTHNYFTGYWTKYECQLTICTSNDQLLLQPENINVNCIPYFGERIQNDGLSTESPELYFLNYNPGENGYMAVLDFYNSLVKLNTLKVYVELYPKHVTRDLGFPDLLVNKEVDKSPDLSAYSYAKFQNGELYKRVGDYFYNFNLSHYGHTTTQFLLFNQSGYNHLYYNIDNEKSLIISIRQKSILDILAPFSYLFLFFIIFFVLVFFISIFPFTSRSTSFFSFRTRLQISISSVILFSFVVIGAFTLVYINNLNEKKNKDIIIEKTHSVLVEMQHKFSTVENFDDNSAQRLPDLLVKFASVFFTDINIFDLNGQLISSSRMQIYNEKLISDKIDPEVFKMLSIEGISLYIHEENIGKQEYLSAYIPFVNDMGEVIGYLNLPYFAKENDLKKEISTFLVAYINIYVILIAISLLIAILISNYISHPIKMIMTKIRQVKLGGQNETINWIRKDEIGQLVEEYNRMIDELAMSAALLAKSERESAWREMAKQIAHEIKNPLTPMKLSVQYLQRAWQNELPDYEKRLDKFTQTMIEQIDALSIIASEFSDFAKMPFTNKIKIDLVEIIQNTIILFKTYDKINFHFVYDEHENYSVYADKEQLLRAFNNLIKNSIQAIGNSPNGKIEIIMKRQFQNIAVEITDNGDGISEEIAGKIFSPNFTTKSGGMGLGLAIVKNIIENSGGEISYKSGKNRGTTFSIILPQA